MRRVVTCWKSDKGLCPQDEGLDSFSFPVKMCQCQEITGKHCKLLYYISSSNLAVPWGIFFVCGTGSS